MTRLQFWGIIAALAVLFGSVAGFQLQTNKNRARDQRIAEKKQQLLILQVAVDRVDVGRKNCKRAKLDRRANARGWKAAENARLVAASKEVGIEHETDLKTARLYHEIAAEMTVRSNADCKKRFPYPTPPPGVTLPPPTPAS